MHEGITMSTSQPAVLDAATLSGDYSIDVAHTTFGFSARHAMVTKVRGRFHEFDGKLHLDFEDANKSSVAIEIKATSIDTGNQQRDDHLRSNDFFAMDDYPTITFRSTSIERVDGSTFHVIGDLTIRGVTKQIEFDSEYTGAVKDPWGNTRVGLTGSVTVNRKDWGVSWNMALEAGGVAVSEKVTLEFDISATKTA
jgi:polyisoprenoid-binding protein YceI